MGVYLNWFTCLSTCAVTGHYTLAHIFQGGFLLKVKVQDLDHRVGDVVDLIYHTIATTPAPRASVAKGELKVIKGSRQTTSSTS